MCDLKGAKITQKAEDERNKPKIRSAFFHLLSSLHFLRVWRGAS